MGRQLGRDLPEPAPSGWSTWKVWQYADNGTRLRHLRATSTSTSTTATSPRSRRFAGGAPWGAAYVSQSWPLASTTMTMTVKPAWPASITLKNIGTKSWDTNTKLGTTQPRDRSSAFADGRWLAPEPRRRT